MPLDIPFTEFEDACVSSTFRLFYDNLNANDKQSR